MSDRLKELRTRYESPLMNNPFGILSPSDVQNDVHTIFRLFDKRVREFEAELARDNDWAEHSPRGLNTRTLRILWDDSRAENRKLKAELAKARTQIAWLETLVPPKDREAALKILEGKT